MKSSRRGTVDPFIVMDVMQAASAADAAGRHIIHMEVGQPGTGAPSGATAALARAMDQGALGYTVALGLPALRARQRLRRRRQLLPGLRGRRGLRRGLHHRHGLRRGLPLRPDQQRS